jgi:hypothetical protein
MGRAGDLDNAGGEGNDGRQERVDRKRCALHAVDSNPTDAAETIGDSSACGACDAPLAPDPQGAPTCWGAPICSGTQAIGAAGAT